MRLLQTIENLPLARGMSYAQRYKALLRLKLQINGKLANIPVTKLGQKTG